MRLSGQSPFPRMPTLVSAALLAALAPSPSAAVEFRGGQHVTVASGEVVADDLYATGETVTVDGTVEGDLVASGGEIRLNGTVTGDLIAAGQAVVIDGRVGDDVRIAGMALRLGPAASAGDDIVAAGFSFETLPDSLTGGSLILAVFQALLAGEIVDGLLGSASALEIRGAIGGDSAVEIGGDPSMPSFVQYIPSPVPLPSVPGGLTIADTARLDGAFEYTSASEARGGGATAASIHRAEPAAPDSDAVAATRKPRWRGQLFRWLGLVALGLLLAWWVPGWLDARGREITARPLAVAGIGLLGVAALPVGLILALTAVVVISILLGLLKLGSLAALAMVLGLVGLALVALLFWLTFFYLAPVLVGLSTGRWVLGRLAVEKAQGIVLPLVAGVVLLALLRFVPYLGFLVALALLLLGWGAVLVWLWNRSRNAPAATAAA